MLCNNIKNLVLIISFLGMHYCVAPEITDNQHEFVQPKKQHKRISINTLKENNIENCSKSFEFSFNLVERLGRFQKKLQQTINKVFKEDIRDFQEKTGEQLVQINDLLQQMENLLVSCEKRISNVIL